MLTLSLSVRPSLAVALATASATFALVSPVRAAGAPLAPVAPVTDPVCPNEDEPGWSWAECGNGYRGVILRTAPARCTWATSRPGCVTVVSMVRFCRLARAHRISWSRTPFVHGDGTALHTC